MNFMFANICESHLVMICMITRNSSCLHAECYGVSHMYNPPLCVQGLAWCSNADVPMDFSIRWVGLVVTRFAS